MTDRTWSRYCTGLLIVAAFAPTLTAQGSYIELWAGDANAVSDDGTVVAGIASGDVYRWTATGGAELLLPFTGTGGNLDMSGDGNVLTFDLKDPSTGRAVAARWKRPLGWQSLGWLPTANPGCGLSDAYATNRDGSVVVGLGWDGCSGTAFRWEFGSGAMTALPRLGRSARANCVSGDGTAIGGWDSDPSTGVRRATAWFMDSRGEVLLIPPSPANPSGLGEAWEINSDGSVIVGGTVRGGEPFRWTPTRGYEELGPNPGTVGDLPTAYATNEDGSMIAGAFGTAFGATAFMWTEEDGMMKLEQFLQLQGITVPPGEAFNFVFDMTPDGSAFVGRRGAYLSSNRAGFLVRMPVARKYGANAAPANTVDLTGGGSAKIGGTFVATASNAELGQSFMIVGASSLPSFPLVGGAVLVNPFLVLPAMQTGPTTTSFSLRIPNNPAFGGASLYFQALAPSATQPQGWALSNGLKLTIQL